MALMDHFLKTDKDEDQQPEDVVGSVPDEETKENPEDNRPGKKEERNVLMIRNGIEYKVFKSKVKSFIDAGWSLVKGG